MRWLLFTSPPNCSLKYSFIFSVSLPRRLYLSPSVVTWVTIFNRNGVSYITIMCEPSFSLKSEIANLTCRFSWCCICITVMCLFLFFFGHSLEWYLSEVIETGRSCTQTWALMPTAVQDAKQDAVAMHQQGEFTNSLGLPTGRGSMWLKQYLLEENQKLR